jgi:hypothetical protein
MRLRETARKLLPFESVYRCGAHLTGDFKNPGASPVATIKRGEHGAFYSGLVTCGSVWHCPVCARKIAAGRRKEVEDVARLHQKSGGVAYMATLTVRHGIHQHAKPLKDKISEAWTKLQQGRKWIDAKTAVGLTGSIRALEVTHGTNGWHPHLHVLFLFDTDDQLAADAFGKWLYARWSEMVGKVGLGTTDADAFTFTQCTSAVVAGDYVAKWGPDYELTYAHLKTGKRGSRGPWMLLTDAQNGMNEAGDLFKEYAKAFKGSRQLTWTKGLNKYRKAVATDDEIAAKEPPAQVVVRISEAGFEILKEKRLQAAVLEAADNFHGIQLYAMLGAMGIPMYHLKPGDDLPEFNPKPL